MPTKPQATTKADPTAEFLWLDPHDVTVAPNVRADVDLDADFLASVRRHGILQAVTCQRTVTDEIEVIYGQRRTLAAREAGVRLPALVYPEHLAKTELLAAQVNENEHRAALTTAELINAAEQLALEGLTDADIAGALARPAETVTKLRAAARSEAAIAASNELTLDQSVVVAEFDTDEDAVGQLVKAAARGDFDHVASRLRGERARAEAVANLTATLRDAGVTIIDEPKWDAADKPSRLTFLRTPDGEELTPENHAGCPGHVAWVVPEYYGDELAKATYACAKPADYGHVPTGGGGRTLDPEAEARIEAMRQEQNRLRAAWDAAAKVRRAWVKDALLTRTKPPKGAENLILLSLAMLDDYSIGHRGWIREEMYERAGIDKSNPAALLTLTPARATMRALALALSIWEDHFYYASAGAGDKYVLARLAEWGYELSDIERDLLADKADKEADR
ncbi:hypothetical protein GCM10027418_06400 [Mariniluteicoccus endophyticus]